MHFALSNKRFRCHYPQLQFVENVACCVRIFFEQNISHGFRLISCHSRVLSNSKVSKLSALNPLYNLEEECLLLLVCGLAIDFFIVTLDCLETFVKKLSLQEHLRICFITNNVKV